MQYCSACQKSVATIVIKDLDGGNVTDEQHLCETCAENLGIVQPKHPMKMSAEILEDLLGALKGKAAGASRAKTEECPGCGLALQQFRSTGRLGCPRCYQTFRAELVPLLQRVHEAAQHRGRLPGRTEAAGPPTRLDPQPRTGGGAEDPPGGDTLAGAQGSASGHASGSSPAGSPGDHAAAPEPQPGVPAAVLADLRRQLDEAIRQERYEDAARLRDELRRAESAGTRPGPADGPPGVGPPGDGPPGDGPAGDEGA